MKPGEVWQYQDRDTYIYVLSDGSKWHSTRYDSRIIHITRRGLLFGWSKIKQKKLQQQIINNYIKWALTK